MYYAPSQFALDLCTNMVVEEGFAYHFVREYHWRHGRKIMRVEKQLGDLNGMRECDLKDNYGMKWEIKSDRIWSTSGNFFLEKQALEHSGADKYLVFAGLTYIVPVVMLREQAKSGKYRLVSGGDGGRSLGYLVPIPDLEAFAEMAIDFLTYKPS